MFVCNVKHKKPIYTNKFDIHTRTGMALYINSSSSSVCVSAKQDFNKKKGYIHIYVTK